MILSNFFLSLIYTHICIPYVHIRTHSITRIQHASICIRTYKTWLLSYKNFVMIVRFPKPDRPSQWSANDCRVLPPHVTADLALINRQKMRVSMYDWKIPLVLGYVWSNHDNLILQNPTTFLYTHCLHWLTLKTSFHPIPWLSHSGSDLRCT